MLASGHSMQNSLRWTRRLIVIVLIVANLMAVILADAAPIAPDAKSSFPIGWSGQGFDRLTNYNSSTETYDAYPISIDATDSGETAANMPQLMTTTR
jgi:hypothetical protein